MHLLIWVLAINGIMIPVIMAERNADPAQAAAQRAVVMASLEAQANDGNERAAEQLERMRNGTEVELPEGLTIYTIFASVFVAIGVIIGLQGAVLGERRSGTAQWVLSGPVSRSSFVLSKLLSHSLGFLIVALAVPAVIAFFELRLLGRYEVSAANVAGAAGLIYLHLFFYISLSLMTSTIFRHWGPAVAVPMAVLFGQSMVMSMLGPIGAFLPWALSVQAPAGPSTAAAVLAGIPPTSWAPVASAAVLSVVFVAVAVLVFRREEL